MKKLLGISLVAILAATPLMAGADPIATPATASTQPETHADAVTAGLVGATPYFDLIETNNTTDKNAATAGYVKGAYNAAIKAVNAVHEEVVSITNDALTTAGDGLAQNGHTVSVNAGDGLVINNDNVNVNTGSGLKIDSDAVALDYDNSTIVLDSDSRVSVGTIGKANIAAADKVNGSGTYASDTNLVTQGYVDEKVASQATQAGVVATIKNTDLTVGQFTLASGAVSGTITVPMMDDWSNPNTANASGLQISGNAIALSVGTDIDEGTVTIDPTTVTYTETVRTRS